MEPFPLAAELVDLILCHLDDIRDLRCCRLLSQAFCQAASRILYRSIGVSLHYESTYSERRCKILNDMIESKPYVLSYVRSLRVNLSMYSAPLTREIIVSPDYYTVDPDSIDHQELTKFLLSMTRASALEELVVRRGWGSRLTLRHSGQDVMTALIAIRFMPSLRCLQLVGLEDPPVALVIGHPGLDRTTSISVKRGTLDMGRAEADWKGIGIPTQVSLLASFREAMVDWDSVLRVQSQLSTFDLRETPPFRAVTDIDLNLILPFYEYMQEVQQRMGGRQPPFPQLEVLRYRSFALPNVPSPWEDPNLKILEAAIEMVATECSTVQKLIVDIVIDLRKSFPHRVILSR